MLVQTQAEGAGAQEITRILGHGLTARGYEVHHVFFFRRTAAFDQQPNTYFCAPERPADLRSLFRMIAQPAPAHAHGAAERRADLPALRQPARRGRGAAHRRRRGDRQPRLGPRARAGLDARARPRVRIDRPVRSRRGQLAGGRRRVCLASAPLPRSPGADRSRVRAKAIASRPPSRRGAASIFRSTFP